MAQDQEIYRIAQRLVELGLDAVGTLTEERVVETIRAVGQMDIEHKLPVLKAYQALAEQTLTRQRAMVTSATELRHEDKQAIEKVILAKYAEVKRVEWQVDPMLVGGLTVQVADWWLDSSVRQQLYTIKEQLTR